MRRLLRRLIYFLRQRRFDAEFSEELEFHRNMKTRELEERGADPKAADFAARRALGSVPLAQDQARDVWVPRWLQGMELDCRLAIRSLAATPRVTVVAILSLALGIGANTAIFSLVNSLLLRQLPVVEPERLVEISSPTPIAQRRTAGWTYTVWNQIRQRLQDFDGGLACSLQQRFDLALGAEPAQVDGFYVSGEFFEALGVRPFVGRVLTRNDDVRGGGSDGPVVVISHRLWQQRFDGAADVIGRRLLIGRVPFTIVGVTRPEFFGIEVGQQFDVLLPIGTEPLIRGRATLLDGPGQWLRVMLRLKPEQSVAAANATLRGLQPQIREAALPQNALLRLQQEFLREPFTLVSGSAGVSRLRQLYRRPLLTIFAVVVLVLLVACANIANLLLARGAGRRQEVSVRLALGAPRWRLARQWLVESFVLASLGASFGLVVAAWGSRVLVAQLSTFFDHVFLDVSLDSTVMVFTLTATVATALIFGTLPAFQATRVGPLEGIRKQERGTSSRDWKILSSALVIAQLALSLILVVAAGLFVRTFQTLADMPLGFDRARVLVVYTNMTRVQIEPADRLQFYDRLIRAVSGVPGVAHAAVSMVTPVSGLSNTQVVEIPGAPELSERERTVLVNYISPDWFAAYSTPVHAGRDISALDRKGSRPVLLVNDAFERRFFLGRSAIDGAIALPAPRSEPPMRTAIVGVVGNAIYRSVREEMQPTIFVPLAQLDVTPANVSISVRSSGPPPVALENAIGAALSAVDRNLTFNFLPLADQVNSSLKQERLLAMLSGFFGALALLLGGLGLYSVTAYAVAGRRAEFGIRMALGASPGRVVWLALSRVSVLVGTGIAVGAGIGVWLSQFSATLLYGLQPHDPLTLLAASAILGSTGLLAGWAPAWRASRIDPAEVLREN